MSGLTTSFLLPAAAQVVLVSCKTAVAIAILLLCRRWLATRLSASILHFMWLGVVASLLLPGGFDLPVALRGQPAASAQDQPATAAVATGEGVPDLLPLSRNRGEPDAQHLVPGLTDVGIAAASPVAQATPVAGLLRAGLAWLWAIGVLVVIAVPAWNVFRYQRIVARAAQLQGGATQLLEQCRAHAGVRRHVRLFESAEVPAPAVLGWLSPVLLLPPGMAGRLDASQLRHVFLHELAHVRRHDILANWLATLAQALHWFNPFVWLALRAMRADMEQACDARVLRWLPAKERSSYGRTLIDLLGGFPGRVPVHGLGIVEGQAQLRERITVIARFGSRRATSPAWVALLVSGVTAVAAVQPRFDVPDSTPVDEALPAKETAASAAVPSGPGSIPGAPDSMPATASMAAQDSRPAATSGVAGAPAPMAFTDTVVVRRGAAFASTLTDVREKLAVWSLLSETGSAEFSALFPGLLAEALAGAGSESRLLIMQIWGGEQATDPQVRTALQGIAGSDPAPQTRALAQQLLAPSGD